MKKRKTHIDDRNYTTIEGYKIKRVLPLRCPHCHSTTFLMMKSLDNGKKTMCLNCQRRL